jgi:hypothetical protein
MHTARMEARCWERVGAFLTLRLSLLVAYKPHANLLQLQVRDLDPTPSPGPGLTVLSSPNRRLVQPNPAAAPAPAAAPTAPPAACAPRAPVTPCRCRIKPW